MIRERALTPDQIDALIRRAKETGKPITVYQPGELYPERIYILTITEESFRHSVKLDDQYIIWGRLRCRGSEDATHNSSYCLYDNYWFAYAHVLRNKE